MQKTNYTHPLHISLILEKTRLIFWTNKSMDFNTNVLWVNSSWYLTFMQLIRYELISHNTWITDHTVMDNLLNGKFIQQNSRLTYVSLLQSYFLKYRWFVLCSLQNNELTSIDRLFKNTGWLEREASEMYGISFAGKMDTRKLLLDYSKSEHPMLKDFPTEGVRDVFYDILDNQIEYVLHETIEL